MRYGFFSQASTIFCLELADIAFVIYSSPATMRNKAAAIYTDNDASLESLISRDSSPQAAYALVAFFFWFLAASRKISIWAERAETKRNIADIPNQGATLSCPIRDSAVSPLEDVLGFYYRSFDLKGPALGDLGMCKPTHPTLVGRFLVDESIQQHYVSDNAHIYDAKRPITIGRSLYFLS